jgi:hypothetical protein
MKILKKAWVVLIWIALYLFIFKLIPYLDSKRDDGCEIYHNVYAQSLKYMVVKKYTDTYQHNYEKVEYSFNNNSERGTMIFDVQLNIMFYNLQPGDSVIKKKNSMFYDLKSKTTLRDSLYEFYISCKDTTAAKKPRPDDKS